MPNCRFRFARGSGSKMSSGQKVDRGRGTSLSGPRRFRWQSRLCSRFGSGFIIDPPGLILTNNPVVEEVVIGCLLQLERPLPVHLLYWTVFVNADEDVCFREDIYGRDRRLVEALQRSPS